MVYQDLPRNWAVLRTSKWFSVEDLMELLNAIETVNYSITEQRQQALDAVRKLTTTCPFTTNDRFVENGSFVCETVGDWPRKFSQLITSLSYKSNFKDEKAKFEPKIGQIAEPHVDFNDAHMSFRNSIIAIRNQLYISDGVFDRSYFEAKYRVSWV